MSGLRKKILVTGGQSMVGSLVTFGKRFSKDELNILNPLNIKKVLDSYNPSTLLHLAALVDVDACEEYPDRAYELNVIGTYNIAKACRDKGIKMVYVSSCAVFDGKKKSPYFEKDRPQPISIYGRTKWFGELITSDLVPHALIIRTGWLFGNPNSSKGFTAFCLKKLTSNEEVKAAKDRFGSPTYIVDLLDTILSLINSGKSGIFHVVNNGSVSYFEIAKKIKEWGQFSTEVIPVAISEIERRSERRGKMESLKSDKLILRPWAEALRDYLKYSII